MVAGRPRFKPTAAMREQVERRVAVAWRRQDIAEELSISIPTLELYFETELRLGQTRKRGKVLDLLWANAKRGNLSAQRLLVAMQLPAPDATPEAVKVEKMPKLGKKEIAKQQAESAGEGTDWGDDLIPGAGIN